MERNKYILGIVLGFVVIIGLGLVSIKLFRAKRSVAPEQEAAMSMPTATPSAVPTSSNETAAYSVPEVASSKSVDSASLPAPLRSLVGDAQNGVQVMSVEFKGGQTGLQFTREAPVAYAAMTKTFKEAVLRDRSLLAYRIGAEESTFAFRSTNPPARVVVTAKEKTATTTSLTGYIIFE